MFKHTLKQLEAVKILASSDEAALLGGSRSGKTFIIIRSIIIRACKTKSRHLIALEANTVSLMSMPNQALRALPSEELPLTSTYCARTLVLTPRSTLSRSVLARRWQAKQVVRHWKSLYLMKGITAVAPGRSAQDAARRREE